MHIGCLLRESYAFTLSAAQNIYIGTDWNTSKHTPQILVALPGVVIVCIVVRRIFIAARSNKFHACGSGWLLCWCPKHWYIVFWFRKRRLPCPCIAAVRPIAFAFDVCAIQHWRHFLRYRLCQCVLKHFSWTARKVVKQKNVRFSMCAAYRTFIIDVAFDY